MTLTFSRRRLFYGAIAGSIVLAGCKREASKAERCSNCGMLVDPKSAFRTEVVEAAPAHGSAAFDSPKCALSAVLAKRSPGVLRVQEFYSRAVVDGSSVRFVSGSDVEGPMGPDLIPVSPEKTDKFMSDHHGKHAYRFEEITAEILKAEATP